VALAFGLLAWDPCAGDPLDAYGESILDDDDLCFGKLGAPKKELGGRFDRFVELEDGSGCEL
jgi:hypothetical protein